MGIHFVCHHCGYALHVKDFQAGKRGKCPTCNGSFRIPAADASYSSALEDASENPAVVKVRESLRQGIQSKNESPSKSSKLAMSASDSVSIAVESNPIGSEENRSGSQAASPVLTDTDSKAPAGPLGETIGMPDVLSNVVDAKWFVRPPSGGQFGPASSTLLMNWIGESRVTADSFLWREGLAQWQLASLLVPELFAGHPPVPAIATSLNEIPSTDRTDAKSTPSDIVLEGSPTIRSGAVLKKRLQKRRRQLTMVILLALISLILLGILISVLVFQGTKPPQTSALLQVHFDQPQFVRRAAD